MLEKKVEDHLVKLVESRGGKCLKWVCPGTRGAPDRICIWPRDMWGPLVVFVETKAPKKGPRGNQLRFHKMLRDLGNFVEVVSTIEEVEHVVNAYALHLA